MSGSKQTSGSGRDGDAGGAIPGDRAGDRAGGETHEANHETQRSLAARIWDQVGTLVLAITIALAIRSFLVEPFRIPSGSMLPTLLIGDHLFVNKFLYGPRVPFSEIRLPGIRDPERGDVVVFEVARGDGRSVPLIVPVDEHPELPRDDFVKRIVGMPGDRVAVSDGEVTVNGVLIDQQATGRKHMDEVGRSLAVRTEFLDGCTHAMLDDPHFRGLDKAEFVVPEGRYFMMGDNRDYSNDSRKWGTVRLEEMKGPAFILYWSWDVNGNALQFFNPVNWWSAEKRWDRVFSPVQCTDESETRQARNDVSADS
jgi:signal peptidase I